MASSLSEKDLCSCIISYLRDLKWKVWQEVSISGSSGRADIVAKLGSVIWVIEAKVRLNIDLLIQSQYWLKHANIVSVASYTPSKGYTEINIVKGFVENFNVGYMVVNRHQCEIREICRPQFRRRVSSEFTNVLTDDTVNLGVAGTQWSNHDTPFRSTARKIYAYLISNPGCTLDELFKGISHHYSSISSAKSSIVHWIKSGYIDWVKIDSVSGKYRLYIIEENYSKWLLSVTTNYRVFGQ